MHSDILKEIWSGFYPGITEYDLATGPHHSDKNDHLPSDHIIFIHNNKNHS